MANKIKLTSAVGTDSQTVLAQTKITKITYSTTGATGSIFSGLTSGISGKWVANVITISGTPTTIGSSNYKITLTGGTGATVRAYGSINVISNPSILTPKLTLTDNEISQTSVEDFRLWERTSLYYTGDTIQITP